MQRTLVLETVKKIGKKVLLKGWVHALRDHGQVAFIDLRDRSGLVQVVGGEQLRKLHPEDVVSISGTVKKRQAKLINPKIKTGKVEVKAEKVSLLNKAKDLPFPINSEGYEIDETVRLKYRYLDLRRPRLSRNIKVRSQFVQRCREFLFKKEFVEIETPLLTKSTPEGSRDFIVPARLQPGKFFALPQSPQQYKQLLMVAGFERYFQIARCIRDEDLRANRTFEHTQIDMEMSFIEREEVMGVVEEMFTKVFESFGKKIFKKPFPVYSYQEAMKKFGADKFDLRSEKEKKDGVMAFAWVIDFPFFEKDKEDNWTFTHNPFSEPIPEHKKWLLEKKNIGKILTTQYDLVCNGDEVGGGSIRSHQSETLSAVFEIMGYSKPEIQEKFGHMLEAFKYGAPPHGGIAPGVDRLVGMLTAEEALREVVAFPQTSSGTTAVMDAPSELDETQLNELHIAVVGKSREDKGEEVYQKIIKLLENKKTKYQTYEHEPVFTSEQSAKVRGTKIKQGAKALVMFADKQPVMLVLSAATKVDAKAFKKQYQVKDLRMATAQEVEQKTGTKIGAVPPLGNLFELPVYVDEKLGENTEIAFNAGLHTNSIKMTYQDFVEIVKPKIGKFSR